MQFLHPCEIIFTAAGQINETGKRGVCRITGKESKGVLFQKWVKDTFTNHDLLQPGEIISNEALFCFDEASDLLRTKTGREKPQRFRTYSHIVTEQGDWLCFTKSNKSEIVDILKFQNPQLVCLTDSGQKHVLFKNRPPMWQLDDLHVFPDVPIFSMLHETMMSLLTLGFSQGEIQSGNYYHSRVINAGFSVWKELESNLSPRRGEPVFDFSAWLMFTDKTKNDE